MNKGFTLVEVLITLAVSSILMIGIFSAFKTQQDSYLAQEQVVETQQNIRAGLLVAINEIRMAGFDPLSKAGAGITTATRARFAFTQDLNADGDTADPDESITLGILAADDANNDGMVDGSGTTSLTRNSQAVADNIQAIEFYYHLFNDTPTVSPTTTQLPSIQSVQISVLARADKPDRKYTDVRVYTTPSGQTWGPFNDHFRRRFQTVTVACPNMGL